MRDLALVVLLTAGCPAAPEPAPPPPDPMLEAHANDAVTRLTSDEPSFAALPAAGKAEVLAHIAGCWEGYGGPDETWLVSYTRPLGGLVLGTTRHIRGNKLLVDEFERFVVGDDGQLGVTPIANGIVRDRFVYDVNASAPERAIFQRVGDGFPQVLTYARVQGRLEVTAAGGGQALALQLDRASCR